MFAAAAAGWAQQAHVNLDHNPRKNTQGLAPIVDCQRWLANAGR